VSVWIFKGEIIGEVDLTPAAVTTRNEKTSAPQQERRRSPRRNRRQGKN